MLKYNREKSQINNTKAKIRKDKCNRCVCPFVSALHSRTSEDKSILYTVLRFDVGCEGAKKG